MCSNLFSNPLKVYVTCPSNLKVLKLSFKTTSNPFKTNTNYVIIIKLIINSTTNFYAYKRKTTKSFNENFIENTITNLFSVFFILFYFIFIYKFEIEILFRLILVYLCETPFWRLEI